VAEYYLERFVEVVDEVEVQGLADFGGDVFEVALVFSRLARFRRRRCGGRPGLFFHAADGHDPASQRNFAGHGDVAIVQLCGERRYQG